MLPADIYCIPISFNYFITNYLLHFTCLPRRCYAVMCCAVLCCGMYLACKGLYHGYRAKFLMIVYWIAATYVLADVYSAQLTSQFARPPHEAPINTLQRLQTAMLRDGYQLFVEKESSSLEMLEVALLASSIVLHGK